MSEKRRSYEGEFPKCANVSHVITAHNRAALKFFITEKGRRREECILGGGESENGADKGRSPQNHGPGRR